MLRILGFPIILITVNYTTGRVDFNDSVHIVTVPAGQRVYDITVNIQIFDDLIDEAVCLTVGSSRPCSSTICGLIIS